LSVAGRPPARRRWGLIVVGVVLFLVVSLLVARWLATENTERTAVTRLLQAQSRGDATAMLRDLRCRDTACLAVVRANARTLRGHGDLSIARYDSGTSHALGTSQAPTRVVWTTPGRLTTVQCVLVRRTGTPLSGPSVTLLRLSAPIRRTAACR
jgi:hypothetical protein